MMFLMKKIKDWLVNPQEKLNSLTPEELEMKRKYEDMALTLIPANSGKVSIQELMEMWDCD